MPEIGTSGSMSGDGKRSDCPKAQATAPILDSTTLFLQSISSVGDFLALSTIARHRGVGRRERS
jgi:hypothetical protein